MNMNESGNVSRTQKPAVSPNSRAVSLRTARTMSKVSGRPNAASASTASRFVIVVS